MNVLIEAGGFYSRKYGMSSEVVLRMVSVNILHSAIIPF